MLDNIPKKSIFSKIYYAIIVGFFLCLIIILLGVDAEAATDTLADFDLLNTGNINGQDGWNGADPVVSIAQSVSSPNSVLSGNGTAYKNFDLTNNQIALKIYVNSAGAIANRANFWFLYNAGLNTVESIYIDEGTSSGFKLDTHDTNPIADNISFDQWHDLYMFFDDTEKKIQFQFNENAKSAWFDYDSGTNNIIENGAYMYIGGGGTGRNIYTDNIRYFEEGTDYDPDVNFEWSDYMKINQFAPRDNWSEANEDDFQSLHDKYLFASGYAYETFLFPWSDPRILQASTTYETLFNFKPFPNSTTTDNVEWNKPWTWNDADTTIWETETALLKVYRAKNNYLCSTTTLQIDFDSVVNFGHPDDDSDLLFSIDLISFGEENLCSYASTTLHYETAGNYCDTTYYPLNITTEPAGYCRQYKAVYLWDGTGRWAFHNFTFLSVYDSLKNDLIVFEAPDDWIIDDDFIFKEPTGFWEKLLLEATIGDSEKAQDYIAYRMDLIYNSLNAKFPSNYVAYVINEVQDTIDTQATTTCFSSFTFHFWDTVEADTGEICLNQGIPANKKSSFDILLMLALFPIVFGVFYSLFSHKE